MSADPVPTQILDMKIDPTRAMSLVEALGLVKERVAKVAGARNVRLVAVSKLKPPSDILALYKAGHRHFGENYAQELMEKATLLPRDVKWHFIGGLQSNKCRPLAASVTNLHLVSSIDTIKKATQLNAGRLLLSPSPEKALNIHIQVNTSGEASKSGSAPGLPISELALHVVKECPHLRLLGLMTIGAIARSKAVQDGEENEDFKILVEERRRLEGALRGLGTEWEDKWGKESGGGLELSMGMSDDFEVAILMGSSEVRVGTTIFGTRPPKDQFRVMGSG